MVGKGPMEMGEYGFNILLDRLPQEWKGIPIDTDFQIGIQMFWALEDDRLSYEERLYMAGKLLFDGQMPEEPEDLIEAVSWFLNGWNTDNLPENRAEAPVMDYQQDQWRIWTAFIRQYGINLNRKKLHFWEFMALLRNLDECAFTRVVEIRDKKLTAKMSAEEKQYYREQKRIYDLRQQGKKQEYTEEEKGKIDAFDELRKNRINGGGMSDQEKNRVNEFMRYSTWQQGTMEESE